MKRPLISAPAAWQPVSITSICRLRTAVVLFWLITATQPARAQLPATQLDGVFPLGAAAGSTVDVTISGDDLDEVERLQFSHTGITARQKTTEPTRFDDGPQAVPNVFEVTIAGNVQPGRYQIRCQGKYGLSNPRSFVVGSLPEVTEAEPNDEISEAVATQTPAVLNGQSQSSADVDWYEITGPAGKPLIIAGQAHQFDSLMSLVLTAYDASGNILREARGAAVTDPVLETVVPQDGKLWLKVHDSQFRQGSGYAYRIEIRNRPQIDLILPPAAVAGKTGNFTIYGRNLPGGAPSSLSIDGVVLQQKQVRLQPPADASGKLQYSGRIEPHVAGLDGFEFRLTEGNQISNPILVTLTDQEMTLESADNDRPDTAQSLTLPCEIAGQFYPQRDVDWYQFEAKKDDVFCIEVYSHRLGLNTDATFLLQQITKQDDGTEKTRDIVFLDDVSRPNNRNESGRHEFETSSADPSYLFTAPADGTYRLLLRDSASSVKSDPRLVYRLAIRKPQHDFRLIAVPADSLASLNLRREGREAIRVFAERYDGFDGDIRVRLEGLPAGVTAEEILIGPSNRMGTLVMTASDQAQPATATVRVTGVADIDGRPVTRTARFGAVTMPYRVAQPNSQLPNVPARITQDIQLSVTDDEPAPVLLTIGEGKPIETSRGLSMKVKYAAAKRDGIGGNLIGFPMDFPAGTTASQVNIGSNKEGEFELRFNSTAPPGTYSLYLAGYVQNMPYQRNPESVERARKRQERVQKILDDANKASQEATRLAQTKANELNTANSMLSTATSVARTAEQALTNATAQFQTAEKTRDERKKQSAAAPDNEDLKKQLADAETAVTNAAKKLQQAKADAEKARTKLDEAQTQQKTATEEKAAADKAAAEAREFAQEAQREKTRVDQDVRTKEQAARQRNINVIVPSNTLTVKLTESPVQLQAQAAPAEVTQGETTEIPLKFTRLYDYEKSISVQAQMPPGVSGISIGNINVGDRQTDGILKVSAAPTATPGEHKVNIRCTMNLNGQLVMERTLVLKVIEKPESDK